MKIAFLLASTLGVLACCGDNIHQGNADASHADAAADAPLDAFVECNYTEQHDTTNDYIAARRLDPTGNGAVEETGITFTPNVGETRTVCGTINNGHFDNVDFSVDIDNYGITLTEASDILVRLTGNAQNISQVGVFVGDENDQGIDGNFILGSHGVFSTHLAAGKYHFSVEAYDNQDATASVPYEMRITTDNPTARCPKLTTPANYTEAADGAANNANDVLAIDYSVTPKIQITGSTTDAAEPSNLILNSANQRITGTSASVALQGSYFDRDTYLVTTGATTNELAIRLNWPGTADLDYYLFQENSTTPIGSAARMQSGEDEFSTFSVGPNKRYWLWVGAYQSTTTLPVTYDATLCPTTYP